MKQLAVSEIFHSIQGEGLYVGTPSVFLRTFGCNLTCPGFGGEIPDYNKYKDAKLEDIPIPSGGCDSFTSWHKNFRHLSTLYTPEAMLEKLKDYDYNHLVITGGEPLLLGNQEFFATLLRGCCFDFETITFETNGTQELYYDLTDWSGETVFSVSPKLSSSGEPIYNTLKPFAVQSYSAVARTVFKFVITNPETDMKEIRMFLDAYGRDGKWDVYLMPAGGTLEEYTKNSKAVAELAMKHGYNYSPRLHINLFGNTHGT